MKVLPLWQPWAQLVVLGAKRVETRSWVPSRAGLFAGERIAIHATKGGEPGGKAAYTATCARPEFATVLHSHGLTDPDELPRGAIIGTVTLERWSRMTPETIHRLKVTNPFEYAFGLYEPGRVAWVLKDPKRYDEPLEFSATQGVNEIEDRLLPDYEAPFIPVQESLL